MIAIIIGLLIIYLFTFACFKVCGDADRRIEQMSNKPTKRRGILHVH